jgi:hypothetical protein
MKYPRPDDCSTMSGAVGQTSRCHALVGAA